MFWLIVRKEIAHNVLSFRFAVTYGLLFLLVLLAVFLMGNEQRRRMQEYTTEVTREREQLSALAKIQDPNKQFEEFQRTTFSGARLPRPLSLLAQGLEGTLPAQVSSRGFFFFASSEERLAKNPLFEVFQTPDLVYVVNVILSLLALLFVFDAVCGEKEQGTLKLLLSNSVPRDLVLLGKWVGGYVSVVAPFSAALLGGLLYLSLAGILPAGALGRFGLIYLLSLVYLSAFFTLGLLISCLTFRTPTSLLVCLLVWIGGTLVIPNLAPVVGRLAAPVPDRQVIEAEKQAVDRESQLLMEALRKRKVYGDQEETERLQQEGEKRKNKLDQFYQDRMQAQVSLTQNLARVSPSAGFLFASTRLAGTGPELYRYFQQAQERFQKGHSEYMQKIFRGQVVEWTREGPRVKDPNWFNPDALPRFAMADEPLGDSFNAALFDILLLLVFNAVFFMLAYVSFLRYDIT